MVFDEENFPFAASASSALEHFNLTSSHFYPILIFNTLVQIYIHFFHYLLHQVQHQIILPYPPQLSPLVLQLSLPLYHHSSIITQTHRPLSSPLLQPLTLCFLLPYCHLPTTSQRKMLPVTRSANLSPTLPSTIVPSSPPADHLCRSTRISNPPCQIDDYEVYGLSSNHIYPTKCPNPKIITSTHKPIPPTQFSSQSHIL